MASILIHFHDWAFTKNKTRQVWSYFLSPVLRRHLINTTAHNRVSSITYSFIQKCFWWKKAKKRIGKSLLRRYICISNYYKPNNSAKLGNDGKKPNPPLGGFLPGPGGRIFGPIPGWPACNCGGALFGLLPIPLGPVPNALGLGPVPKPFVSPGCGSFRPGTLSFVGDVGVFGKFSFGWGAFAVGLKTNKLRWLLLNLIFAIQ